MKLKLKGYILRRCDTNEYLHDYRVDGDLGLVSWSTFRDDALLFNSKYDAMIVGSDISNAIKVVMKLSQVFKFEDDFLVSCLAMYDPNLIPAQSKV